MTMAPLRGSGYSSFPRTTPASPRRDGPPASPWSACMPGPETDQPPSPVVTEHHHKRSLQRRGQRHRERQHKSARQQEQPNFPTTIQFTPSPDDDNITPFDEDLDWGLGPALNGASLEDTHGFDNNSKSDNTFERLYNGADEEASSRLFVLPDREEEGTLQSSSVELNPYPAKASPPLLTQQTKQMMNLNKDSLKRHQAEMKATMQRERGSIFRTQPIHPIQQSSQRAPRSSDRKTSEQMLSPTIAMDRRRSAKPATQARSEVAASPSSSIFTSAAPIRRTNTGTSLSRRNNNASPAGRHRSVSRSHRSRSRTSRNGRRSRSRSTSVAPKKDDDYHQSLFRGAALIREQLLRSMASADASMDEAEREHTEAMIERGERQQQLRAAREARRSKDECDINTDDIDYDYSLDGRVSGANSPANGPSPSRVGSGVRFAPSQDSSTLETESRRLDNLVSILNATSSTASSSNPGAGTEFQRSSSDKENDVQTMPNAGASRANLTIETHDVISPTSTLGLTSPAHNISSHSEYASRYFEDDAPKPALISPIEEEPVEVSLSDVQRHRPEKVDEALAHAQRAGPLWRSLMQNHVRFPKRWEGTLPATAPPIHNVYQRWSKWFYVARHRVKGDKRLNSREYGVRSRRSGGRILLRVLVREMHSQQVCREIAIGCLHPNSKGIRRGDPSPEAEDVREVWMAVRWLTDDDEPSLDLRNEADDYEGVLDSFLLQKRRSLDYGTMGSALGHRKAVHNENVRAVFGDQPPMTTIDLHEDEIAEILKANGSKKLSSLPALMLLKLFLFAK
ncbi:hypothetical protein ACHAXT_000435 [Thalassiosira profunda]